MKVVRICRRHCKGSSGALMKLYCTAYRVQQKLTTYYYYFLSYQQLARI